MAFWNRRKSIDAMHTPHDEAAHGPRLKATLSWPHLLALGVGAIVGTGILTLIGVGAGLAGPAVLVSFGLAGLVCACAALAYAELSTMMPAAGSAYTYSYAVLGELIAWIVGWSLILEYSLVVSAVAVGWSGAMLEAKTNAEQANNGVKIAYSLPKEGAPVWFDTLVLLKDAPNRAQGLAFIDYLLRPEVIAPVSDHLSYPNGNRAATPLVAEATRDNPAVYPSAAAMATLYTLEPLPKATERVRTRVWSKVKNGQ